MDEFHAQVSEQTGSALRAETSVFAPFEWENLTMKTDNYKAEGGDFASVFAGQPITGDWFLIV